MNVTCRIHSKTVGFSWPDAATGAVVVRMFAYFGWTEAPSLDPEIQIQIGNFGAEPIPEDASVYQNGVRAWRHGTLIRFQQNGCTALIHPRNEQPQVLVDVARPVDDQAMASGLFNVLVMSLLLTLRTKGLFPLHAAALVTDEIGVLVVAKSDSGKSTLSYALVREGWQYLSDDAVLLVAHDHEVVAAPFRRRFCLDPDARVFFPELADAPTRQMVGDGKQSVDVDTVFQNRRRDVCRPEMILFPEIVDASESRCTRLSAPDAFQAIMPQSPYFDLDPAMSSLHFSVIQDLLRQSACYRLEAGRDVLERPSVVSRYLRSCLVTASV